MKNTQYNPHLWPNCRNSRVVKKSESRNTMVTSDCRPEVVIRPFCACAMHPAVIIATIPSLWTGLWSIYHVPLNAFQLTLFYSFNWTGCMTLVVNKCNFTLQNWNHCAVFSRKHATSTTLINRLVWISASLLHGVFTYQYAQLISEQMSDTSMFWPKDLLGTLMGSASHSQCDNNVQ